MHKSYPTIIKAGLIVGTLDILSAFAYYVIKSGKHDFWIVLKFVATGIFGTAALTGGGAMMVAGLVFHYIIAFAFTIFFFWLFPNIKILAKNKIVTGIVYGLFIWAVMNLVVVPLSNVPSRPFHMEGVLINAAILIIMIGIPLSFMANSYYKNVNTEMEHG